MQDIHYKELIAQINQDIAAKGELSPLMEFEDVKRLNIHSTAYEEWLAEAELKEMSDRREIPVRPEFEGNALVRGVKGLIRKLITATVIPMQLEQNVWNNQVVRFSKICFGKMQEDTERIRILEEQVAELRLQIEKLEKSGANASVNSSINGGVSHGADACDSVADKKSEDDEDKEGTV